jgi:hypothetical protein
MKAIIRVSQAVVASTTIPNAFNLMVELLAYLE